MPSKKYLMPLYIASTAIAGIIGFHIIFSSGEKMKKSLIRVAYNFSSSPKGLDSASILNASQYNLIRNLYGRLVATDSNSQLVADVAESFSTNGDTVTFLFGDKVKTVDGNSISAKDAEISLKRLIILGKSGHGDIRRFLCPNFSLKNLTDTCPGISVTGNHLVLKAAKPHYLPLLISALESADYSIIPAEAVDKKTLEITNYRNTSGPYFLEKILKDGSWLMTANIKHYLYDPKMPQSVQLIPTEFADGPKKLQMGEVDLLPTTMPLSVADSKIIIESAENEVHETLPIKVNMVRFSPRAIREFSPEQRRFAGLTLAKILSEQFSELGGKPTFQFLQSLSSGALDNKELSEEKLDQRPEMRPKFSRPIEFVVGQRFLEFVQNKFKDYPEIKIVVGTVPILSLAPDLRPDMYTSVNDSAWTEDVSFLGYNFENKIFYVPGLDHEKWMTDFLETEDRLDRNKKVKELQLKVLKTASFVPFAASPYYAVTKKPWHLNQSTLDGGTRFWRIRHD